MGQTEREVYVWAYCASTYAAGPSQGSVPAVIHLGVDGSVQSAEIPGSGSAYGPDIQRMFPADIQGRIFDHAISLPGAHEHMRWRRGHPEEPPLIVLPFLPARPTQTLAPMITPAPIQVEDWKEYQTVLAQQFDYLPPEQVICEWEFLGRLGNEIYVWAVCGAIMATRVGIEGLAIVYVREDGSAATALRSEDRSMYPADVQEKYFNGLIHFQELVDHLRWRQSHPEELPLIVTGLPSTP